MSLTALTSCTGIPKGFVIVYLWEKLLAEMPASGWYSPKYWMISLLVPDVMYLPFHYPI